MPKSNGETKTPKEVNVKIVPTNEKKSERIYSNFVQVSCSPHDVTLTFCDILPVRKEQQSKILESKQLEAPVQVEVVIPLSLVEPLIKAMTDNYERFKKLQQK